MDEELKPCPFCGGEAEVLISTPAFYVHCRECDVEGPAFGTEKKAVAAWNTRA